MVKAEGSLKKFVILTAERVRLDPLTAFIVSNSVISEVLLCLPELAI